MTKAQIILKKWIDKNFETGSVKITFPTEDRATITDKNGQKMTITMNLYCDILEYDTKKILAKSNLPHDLEKIGQQLPTDWTEIPYQN